MPFGHGNQVDLSRGPCLTCLQPLWTPLLKEFCVCTWPKLTRPEAVTWLIGYWTIGHLKHMTWLSHWKQKCVHCNPLPSSYKLKKKKKKERKKRNTEIRTVNCEKKQLKDDDVDRSQDCCCSMCNTKIKKRKCYTKEKIGSREVRGDTERKTEQKESRCRSAEGLKVHQHKALEFLCLSVVCAPCPFLSGSAVFPVAWVQFSLK